MKQYLKIVLFSCIIGTIFAGLFFFNIKEKAEAKTTTVAYAFQVGVFKNQENAKNLSEQYTTSKIIKDGDLYRVFIGLTSKNKEKLENLYNENNYYIKEIILTANQYSELVKYDVVLEKTENPELIIKNMLEIMPDEL